MKIKPGKTEQLTVYSTSGPPMIVNAEAQKTAGKAWGKRVIVEKIEYSDGSQWARL